MSILFTDIYSKAIALFDDPKITVAYQTNKIQFCKLMYTHLQNAVELFTNPASIGMKLSNYNAPIGTMEVFEGDGVNKSFTIDNDFKILDNSLYCFVEGQIMVQGEFDKDTRIVTFPDVLPKGQQYAFEQYYVGEFTDDFNVSYNVNLASNTLVLSEIKGILARLLVKAWAEDERNLLLDIRDIMQDSDFKITGRGKVLDSKNAWVDQLDSEVLQLQNKLAWNIRFMGSSTKKGIGRG